MNVTKYLKIQIDYLRKKFESEINLLKTENKNLKSILKFQILILSEKSVIFVTLI